MLLNILDYSINAYNNALNHYFKIFILFPNILSYFIGEYLCVYNLLEILNPAFFIIKTLLFIPQRLIVSEYLVIVLIYSFCYYFPGNIPSLFVIREWEYWRDLSGSFWFLLHPCFWCFLLLSLFFYISFFYIISSERLI